jgi:hypothetical protein
MPTTSSPVIAAMRADAAAISPSQAVWSLGPRYSAWRSRNAARSMSATLGETVTSGRGSVSTDACASISRATWGSRTPKVSTRVPK